MITATVVGPTGGVTVIVDASVTIIIMIVLQHRTFLIKLPSVEAVTMFATYSCGVCEVFV